MNATPDKIAVRVISWEAPEIWGVAVDYRNGKRAACEIGTRAEADMECRRLERGDRPLFGPLMGRDP